MFHLISTRLQNFLTVTSSFLSPNVAGWEVSPGIGVESQVTSGVVKGVHNVVANISGSYINNKASESNLLGIVMF